MNDLEKLQLAHKREIDRLNADLAAEQKAHEETIIHLDAMTAGLNTARAELAAANARAGALHDELMQSGESYDALRQRMDLRDAELRQARADLAARDELLKEALDKLKPIAALVDMTADGFPDHDLCPIRLGMARELRELRARIDAVLKEKSNG